MNKLKVTGTLLLWACLLTPALNAQSIGPLPKHLDNATLEEQLAYIEKMAVEAHREKVATGRERYDARKALKESLTEVSRLRAESYIDNVRKQKEQIADNANRSKKQMDFFFHCCVLSGFVAICALFFYYRHSILHFFSRE